MFKTSAIIAAALCTAGLFAAPAMAETAKVTVSYRDLDLASGSDRQQFEARIDQAARTACARSAAFSGTAMPLRAMKQCHETARAQVRHQADVAIASAMAADGNRLGG